MQIRKSSATISCSSGRFICLTILLAVLPLFGRLHLLAEQPWFNCFEVIGGSFTWSQAKLDAEARGGHLATFTSLDEWNQVSAYFGRDTWLGGYQTNKSIEPAGGWTWVTGEPWYFSAWPPGQPDNYNNNEDRLEMVSNGHWNDYPSGGGKAYLIEYESNGPHIATGMAQVAGGFLVGLILTAGGTNYIDVPAVTINGGGGSGASALATLVNGSVSSLIIVSNGVNYTSPPSVFISPPAIPPRQARAHISQIVSGFVVTAAMADRGYGYSLPPNVYLYGGGGTGAAATASVSNGMVTAVTIFDAGTGYSSVPSVVIDPPPTPPRRAVATAQVSYGFVVGVSIIDGGFGYTNAPGIWLLDTSGEWATAVATIGSNGVVTEISITNPGSGYSTNVQVMVAPPVVPATSLTAKLSQQVVFSPLIPGAFYSLQEGTQSSWVDSGIVLQATDASFSTNVLGRANAYRLLPASAPAAAGATASVVNGFLVHITVTNSGTGYTSAPLVTITDTTGTGAIATASVSGGRVTSITIESSGQNYSSAPAVAIDSPQISVIVGKGTPGFALEIENLIPGIPYQLEAASTLPDFQATGEVFISTRTNSLMNISASGSASFYRIVNK